MTFEDYNALRNAFYKDQELVKQSYMIEPCMLSDKTVIRKEDYERHVLGIFNTDKEVNNMSNICRNEYGEYMEECDCKFLFEKEKWNGTKIDAMTNSHIVNTLLMLERKANRYKTSYELFVIDNMNNTMLIPRDSIDDLVGRKPIDWIVTTPIYVALLNELKNRNLEGYFRIVRTRFEEENKDGE